MPTIPITNGAFCVMNFFSGHFTYRMNPQINCAFRWYSAVAGPESASPSLAETKSTAIATQDDVSRDQVAVIRTVKVAFRTLSRDAQNSPVQCVKRSGRAMHGCKYLYFD